MTRPTPLPLEPQHRPHHRDGWRWIFIDWEFIEYPPLHDGVLASIDQISVGAVDVDTADAYYAVVNDPNLDVILDRPFLREHVAPFLPWKPATEPDQPLTPDRFDYDHAVVKPRKTIATELAEFILRDGPKVRIFADYGGYDYVTTQWLWGGMAGRPADMPMHFDDLRTVLWMNNLTDKHPAYPHQDLALHHALGDAIHGARVLRWIDQTSTVLRAARNTTTRPPQPGNEPGY